MFSKIILHKTSQIGLRDSNEDAEKYNINLNIENGHTLSNLWCAVDFFVICDGHGGDEISKMVVILLEQSFMKKENKYPLSKKYINDQYNLIQKKLIQNSYQIAERCGSTALVVVRYIDNEKKENLQIINLGDCRAVLSRNGLAIPLTMDHKPIWPNERRRIDNINKSQNLTEQVIFSDGDWRIGDLSVSRSFGDLDNKPYVSHIPEIYEHLLQNDDEFIIMACDGLWDVMQNHDAVNFIKDHVNNNFENYTIPGKYPVAELVNEKNIAKKMAKYAIELGSTDNISIMIIFLKK